MDPARGELEMVSLLEARLPPPPAGEVWIGDDAAVFPTPEGWLLLAVDTVVEGVHFAPELVGADDVGWKALATSVSDVAAMGAEPLRAVVAASLPDPGLLDRVYDGLLAAAEAHRCPVVGGDLSAGPVLTLSVAVTGVVAAGEPPAVTRSGARPGHRLWVTGALGSSAAGLRALRSGTTGGPAVAAHLRPRARLDEGRVARLAGASAMIDVSDGLSLDLGRLARASGVTAELHSVPVAEGADRDEALDGGEDYELVFSVPAEVDVPAAFAGAGLAPPIEIGRCTGGGGTAGTVLLEGRRLEVAGWEHWG